MAYKYKFLTGFVSSTLLFVSVNYLLCAYNPIVATTYIYYSMAILQ